MLKEIGEDMIWPAAVAVIIVDHAAAGVTAGGCFCEASGAIFARRTGCAGCASGPRRPLGTPWTYGAGGAGRACGARGAGPPLLPRGRSYPGATSARSA